MKLAIVGSRTATDFDLLHRWAEKLCDDGYGGLEVEEIISGGAKGTDTLGAKLAEKWGVKLTEYLPDWDKHGKAAGFIRNEDIIKAADVVLSMWDGQSKGTANSLSIAKRLKKPTLIIYF